MRKLNYLVILFLCGSLISCATLGIDLNTPQKKYLAARVEFNDMMEQYIKVAATIPMEKRVNIRTALKATDTALDTWEKHVMDKNYDFTKDRQVWLDCKNLLLEVLK